MKIKPVKFPFYVVGQGRDMGRVGHCIYAPDEEAARAKFRRVHPGVERFVKCEVRKMGAEE